jgi:hypothetical protein
MRDDGSVWATLSRHRREPGESRKSNQWLALAYVETDGEGEVGRLGTTFWLHSNDDQLMHREPRRRYMRRRPHPQRRVFFAIASWGRHHGKDNERAVHLASRSADATSRPSHIRHQNQHLHVRACAEATYSRAHRHSNSAGRTRVVDTIPLLSSPHGSFDASGAWNVTHAVGCSETHNRSNAARTARKRCNQTRATPAVEHNDTSSLSGGIRAHREELKNRPRYTNAFGENKETDEILYSVSRKTVKSIKKKYRYSVTVVRCPVEARGGDLTDLSRRAFEL